MMSLKMTWLWMLGLDKSLSKMLEHKSAYVLPQLPLEKSYFGHFKFNRLLLESRCV